MRPNYNNTMSLVEEWIETARSVITEPTEFFVGENRRDGFGYPLKFASISIVIAALLNMVATGVRSAISAGFDPISLVSALAGTLIGGLIGLFVGAAIIHLFVYLFGGDQGYKSTLAVMCYATAIYPISAAVSIVPILGGIVSLVVALYGIYLQVKGLEEFQSLSTGQAILSVVLPYVILTIIAIIIAVVVFAAFLSGTSPGVAPLPAQ